VVPDSAPVVTVPIPGRDTTLPLSLKQPLVIDARDDHGLTRLEVVSWRASQTGKQGAAVRESLDVSGAGERAIVQGDLDAEGRGLLPGDTLRLRVEAWDNVPAPGTHMGRSPEIALRLPSLEELRAATRAAARDVAAAADSLSQAERELGTRTRDLAQQRSREAGGTRRPADARDGPRARAPRRGAAAAQGPARSQSGAVPPGRRRGRAGVARGRRRGPATAPGRVESRGRVAAGQRRRGAATHARRPRGLVGPRHRAGSHGPPGGPPHPARGAAA